MRTFEKPCTCLYIPGCTSLKVYELAVATPCSECVRVCEPRKVALSYSAAFSQGCSLEEGLFLCSFNNNCGNLNREFESTV